MDVDLKGRFTFHPATDPLTAETHELIRAKHHELAQLVHAAVPGGREQSLAFTALEESMMWANAGIARAGGPAHGFDPSSYGTG
jgi:hypothetical protein